MSLYFLDTDDRKEINAIRNFFLIAFSFTWITYYVGLPLLGSSPLLDNILETIPKFGFSFSGFVMAWYVGGKPAVKDLVIRSLRFNPVTVLILAFFVPFLIMIAAASIHILLFSELVASPFHIASFPLSAYFYWLGLRIFLGGGMGEEYGLRGFVLPRMQDRWGIRRGTFYLGALWSLWHLPVNIGGGLGQSILSIILQMLLTVPMAFIFTWIFNKTSGNILSVIIFHGSLNGHNAVIERLFYPPLYDQEDIWIIFYVFIILILGIIASTQLKSLVGPDIQ